MDLTATEKAQLTAKWATTMTRWHIGFVTNGTRVGSPKVKPLRRWQLVGFAGPAGRESAGIVDLLAIRKNHGKPTPPFKRGDLFEIIIFKSKAEVPNIQIEAKSGAFTRWQNITTLAMLFWQSGAKERDLNSHGW